MMTMGILRCEVSYSLLQMLVCRRGVIPGLWCRSLERGQVSLGEAEVMESNGCQQSLTGNLGNEVRSGRFFKELELGPKLNLENK
ncbi:hypothetical protein ILYODFUR_024907 [Ilyodon furcidens]|uniref:Uncharacterized protein n=1 Tax=Ilyodon furcidens TaxID=33524 RepID=A0ABV0SRK6_9TELE